MYEGWMQFGGVEIFNASRAFWFSRTADCPMPWLRLTYCDNIAEALGQPQYDITQVESAPWYDPRDPETARFFGIYPTLIEGISDSTRTATITEGILSGGTISGRRHAVRTVRVEAMLSAHGQDALEAGLSWLDAVLEPSVCAIHGDGCGEVDLQFFNSCPPVREFVVEYGDWTLARTNHAVGSGMGTVTTSGTIEITNPEPGSQRATFTVESGASLTGALIFRVPSTSTVASANRLPVVEGDVIRGSVQYRADRARRMRWRWQFFDASGTSITAQVFENDTIIPPAGEWRLLESPDIIAPAGAATVAFDLQGGNTLDGMPDPGHFLVDDYVEIRADLVTINDEDRSFFDGTTLPQGADPDLARVSWIGTPNASASVLETRTATMRPETDAEYQARVDDVVRVLHGVTCISGPTIIEKLHRDAPGGGFWGYQVEFVLAASTPWVFGLPREIDLPSTVPVVVQDIPYNLAPYPSAELEDGDVLVATNYSTNPSVETNTMGWAAVAGAPVSGLVSSRSTDLQAVGLASFLVTFTAAASGTNGTMAAQQEVAIPTTAGLRPSINLWASAAVQSGTAVIDRIEYTALWQDAASATLRTDALGTRPPGGGAVSAQSIQPPTGATKVVVRATAYLTSWASGAVVRLYADALAVTVP